MDCLSASAVSGLYVHVPFCARKCAYCAFFSEPSDGALINRYASALVRELEMLATGFRPRTVFFGGGTPSLLNLQQWEQILGAMQRLNLLGAPEWTVECNPATVSLDKARLLRSYGVNRVSLGVQSLEEDMLDRLGRIHSRKSVFDSFEVLRKAGFENLSLDLMFAIPGQTMASWRRTLGDALAMGSEHLSCYEVIYEEDTPLFRQLQARQFQEDDDLSCAMYEALIEEAEGAGFRQYEVANFARDPRVENAGGPSGGNGRGCIPSLACRHNVNYWRGGSFYGLGPSATEYVGGVRAKNVSNTPLYCERLEQGQRPLETREELAPMSRAGETAAFGLRMVAGWPFDEFRRVTGHDLRDDWADEMNSLVSREWGRWTDEGFQLTRKGLRFADAAAEMFLR